MLKAKHSIHFDQFETEKTFSVELVETILRGEPICRFRITINDDNA